MCEEKIVDNKVIRKNASTIGEGLINLLSNLSLFGVFNIRSEMKKQITKNPKI